MVVCASYCSTLTAALWRRVCYCWRRVWRYWVWRFSHFAFCTFARAGRAWRGNGVLLVLRNAGLYLRWHSGNAWFGGDFFNVLLPVVCCAALYITTWRHVIVFKSRHLLFHVFLWNIFYHRIVVRILQDLPYIRLFALYWRLGIVIILYLPVRLMLPSKWAQVMVHTLGFWVDSYYLTCGAAIIYFSVTLRKKTLSCFPSPSIVSSMVPFGDLILWILALERLLHLCLLI